MSHWTDFIDPNGPDGAYLPWKKVEARVGISRTTAWRLQKRGDFPKPYVMSPGRVAYRESEVEAWKASRAHRSAEVLSRVAQPPSRLQAALEAPSALPNPRTWSPQPEAGPPADARALEAPTPPPAHSAQVPGAASRTRRNRPSGDQLTFEF